MPTAKLNPLISTVKAGRKLVTPPAILMTKGAVTNATELVAISSPDLP